MTTESKPSAPSENEQPAGNYYDKYGTRNPIARALMAGFLRNFDDLVARCAQAKTALEVGCGEGELMIRVARHGVQVNGIDISPDIIAEARRRTALAGISANLRTDSVLDLTVERDQADLLLCCEVMEHVNDPERALAHLHKLCRYRFITSVPREPIWRGLNMLRGKYIPQLGNTPGHVNHWSSSQFLSFLSREFRVIEVRRPMPWTMALCEPR